MRMKRPISLYLSHTWSYGGLANNLAALLDAAVPNYTFQLIMIPPESPVHREENIRLLDKEIRDSMEICSALLLAGGLYDRFGRWIHREIEAAKGNIFAVKPVVTILPWADVPAGAVEKEASNAVVGWNPRELGEALARLI